MCDVLRDVGATGWKLYLTALRGVGGILSDTSLLGHFLGVPRRVQE